MGIAEWFCYPSFVDTLVQPGSKLYSKFFIIISHIYIVYLFLLCVKSGAVLRHLYLFVYGHISDLDGSRHRNLRLDRAMLFL